MIEEPDQIKAIEQKFKELNHAGVDIIDFTRAFLAIIPHQENETLYIVMGLVDLFKEICESFGLTNHVRGSDVINYIVDGNNFILSLMLNSLLVIYLRKPSE